MTKILVNGEAYEVTILSRARDAVRFSISGREYRVEFEKEVPHSALAKQNSRRTESVKKAITADSVSDSTPTGDILLVCAPIPGLVAEILVSVGDTLVPGATLLRLEAMKMLNNITAQKPGKVAALHVQVGDEVKDSQLLMELEQLAQTK